MRIRIMKISVDVSIKFSMKKILILAYDFPPYVSVGGLRPAYWFENFKSMGWEPIVVTRAWNPKHGNTLDYIEASVTKEVVLESLPHGLLIKTPYFPTMSNQLHLKEKKGFAWRFVQKANTAFHEFGQWIFPVGTKYELYKGARSFLKKNRVDAILATGEPFILFKYASQLSAEFSIPWVADYRDPWVKDQQGSSMKYAWDRWNQNRFLKNASCITTVSEFCKVKINQDLPKQSIELIPNGFDEKLISQAEEIPQNKEVLTISMAGSIYDWHPYVSFLESVAQLLKKEPDSALKIQFFGINKTAEIEKILERLPDLKRVVQLFPKIPNAQLINRLAQSNVFLLFNYYSYMGTKIYECLALNRKILLCFDSDPAALALKEKHYDISALNGISEQLQADLIAYTQSGIVVQDANHLQTVLNDLLLEFQTNGFIASNTVHANEFSRKRQTEKLVAILDSI